MKQMSKIYVDQARGMGRGVFSNREMIAGELIEECPLLFVGKTFNLDESQIIKNTNLWEYVFTVENSVYLALGYGSLYNHSSSPNAYYEIDIKKQTIRVFAKENISPVEQILVDYGCNDTFYKFPIRQHGKKA